MPRAPFPLIAHKPATEVHSITNNSRSSWIFFHVLYAKDRDLSHPVYIL